MGLRLLNAKGLWAKAQFINKAGVKAIVPVYQISSFNGQLEFRPRQQYKNYKRMNYMLAHVCQSKIYCVDQMSEHNIHYVVSHAQNPRSKLGNLSTLLAHLASSELMPLLSPGPIAIAAQSNRHQIFYN